MDSKKSSSAELELLSLGVTVSTNLNREITGLGRSWVNKVQVVKLPNTSYETFQYNRGCFLIISNASCIKVCLCSWVEFDTIVKRIMNSTKYVNRRNDFVTSLRYGEIDINNKYFPVVFIRQSFVLYESLKKFRGPKFDEDDYSRLTVHNYNDIGKRYVGGNFHFTLLLMGCLSFTTVGGTECSIFISPTMRCLSDLLKRISIDSRWCIYKFLSTSWRYDYITVCGHTSSKEGRLLMVNAAVKFLEDFHSIEGYKEMSISMLSYDCIPLLIKHVYNLSGKFHILYNLNLPLEIIDYIVSYLKPDYVRLLKDVIIHFDMPLPNFEQDNRVYRFASRLETNWWYINKEDVEGIVTRNWKDADHLEFHGFYRNAGQEYLTSVLLYMLNNHYRGASNLIVQIMDRTQIPEHKKEKMLLDIARITKVWKYPWLIHVIRDELKGRFTI